MKSIGLYVHIPFCVSKCRYCDFYSLPEKCAGLDKKKDYVSALMRHFDACAERYGRLSADTVFFGGGTPTFLPTELLLEIIEGVKSRFDLTRNCEFTLEANPETLDGEKLTRLRSAGVNRLSIGIQSAVDSELSQLGRIHTFESAKRAFHLTRNCGFDNISVDLMYGIPSQTEQSLLYTVEAVTALEPDHVSLYGLQLEEGTPLWRDRDTLALADGDECAAMFGKAVSKLRERGYGRYEISNFAKDGSQCRHNLGYWQGKDYLGFGPGAYSCFGGKRFSVMSDLGAFLTDVPEALITVDETLTDEERAREYVMLSLRLCDGFSVEELFDRTRNAEFYLKRCEPFIKSGFLRKENGRIFFTDRGFDVSNAVLSEILF